MGTTFPEKNTLAIISLISIMRDLPQTVRHWFIVSDLSLVWLLITPVYKDSATSFLFKDFRVFRLATMLLRRSTLYPIIGQLCHLRSP